MSPDELREAGIRLYSVWGWQSRLAEALAVDVSTVRRWSSGQVPVPGPVAVAVRLLVAKHDAEQQKVNFQ